MDTLYLLGSFRSQQSSKFAPQKRYCNINPTLIGSQVCLEIYTSNTAKYYK